MHLFVSRSRTHMHRKMSCSKAHLHLLSKTTDATWFPSELCYLLFLLWVLLESHCSSPQDAWRPVMAFQAWTLVPRIPPATSAKCLPSRFPGAGSVQVHESLWVSLTHGRLNCTNQWDPRSCSEPCSRIGELWWKTGSSGMKRGGVLSRKCNRKISGWPPSTLIFHDQLGRNYVLSNDPFSAQGSNSSSWRDADNSLLKNMLEPVPFLRKTTLATYLPDTLQLSLPE